MPFSFDRLSLCCSFEEKRAEEHKVEWSSSHVELSLNLSISSLWDTKDLVKADPEYAVYRDYATFTEQQKLWAQEADKR